MTISRLFCGDLLRPRSFRRCIVSVKRDRVEASIDVMLDKSTKRKLPLSPNTAITRHMGTLMSNCAKSLEKS